MYIPQLNFTRFLAAVAIVIFHFGQNAYPFNFVITKHLIENLDAVISYFFILSGFVLTLAHTKQGQIDLPAQKTKFWVKRLTRIYPLYLLTVLFITLIDKFTQIELSTFLFNLTLTQAWIPGQALTINTVCWTLSVEIFFYACFPYIFPLITALGNKRLISTLCVLWVANIALTYTVIAIPESSTFYFCPLNHLANFTIGISGATLMIRNYTIFQKRNSITSLMLVITGLISLFLFITNSFFLEYKHSVLMPAISLLLLWTFSSGTGKLIKVLSHQIPVYLGELSYSIYVLQIPVYILYHVYILRYYHFTATQNFYGFMIALLFCSVLCHELIEKQARAYIRTRL